MGLGFGSRHFLERVLYYYFGIYPNVGICYSLCMRFYHHGLVQVLFSLGYCYHKLLFDYGVLRLGVRKIDQVSLFSEHVV